MTGPALCCSRYVEAPPTFPGGSSDADDDAVSVAVQAGTTSLADLAVDIRRSQAAMAVVVATTWDYFQKNGPQVMVTQVHSFCLFACFSRGCCSGSPRRCRDSEAGSPESRLTSLLCARVVLRLCFKGASVEIYASLLFCEVQVAEFMPTLAGIQLAAL